MSTIHHFDVSGFGQFEEFIIAMPSKRQRLVAYQVNSIGIPDYIGKLGELDDMFDPLLKEICSPSFIIPLADDGHMCLLYSSKHPVSNRLCMRIAVFQIEIFEPDRIDNQTIYATLKDVQIHNFGNDPTILSAVVM